MASENESAGVPAKKKARGRVYVIPERCKGCGFCIEFCATRVLAEDESYNRKGYHPPKIVKSDSCTGCDLCGLFCPDFAIHGVRLTTSGTTDDEEDQA